MRGRSLSFLVAFALLLSAPAVSHAQDAVRADVDLQQRHDELVLWLADYRRWEAWMVKWGNKVAFNTAGGIVTKRPQRPDPPVWLADDCRASLTTDGTLADACQILAQWEGLTQAILTRTHLGGLTPTDVAAKTSFLQRIHVSGGWVPAQLPAPQVYLVAGLQVGIVEVGRATLPAVGVGVMAVADGAGGYEWKPATIIGIGYRVASFGFPWVNREANLHLNIARATIHGARSLPVGFDPSQNLVGFSLTFARR